MADMKDFVKEYFSLLNLRSMPDEVLTRLRGYIKKDSYPNDAVKSWKDNFMIQTTTQTGTEWNFKQLPALNDTIATELYISLFRAFRSMANNVWAFNDNQKAVDFVEKFTTTLFVAPQIPNNVKTDVKDFINLVLNDSEISGLFYLERADRQLLKSIVDGTVSIDDDRAKNLAYNVISRFIQTVFQLQQDGKKVPDIKSKLGRDVNLQNIIDVLEDDTNVTPANIADLKNKFGEIFETLYKNKGIRDIFREYDSDKVISGQIDRALKATDYTGKTNESTYVPPTYDDKLNLKQQIDKTLEDTYNDVLKKFVTAHRANIFIKPTAKAIFGALDKAKIKPTDGLKTVIDKKDDILKSLTGKEPFKAAGQFKWLVEQLEIYNKNGMGKAIEGALRNGDQMRHIVEQIIKDGVKNKKVEDVKVALEVLSVMQYGLFTSRTMDAINQTDVNIFSDSGLSWNKNEGIKFVTGAVDKTIKLGIQATGYGITAAVNGIRKANRKFNHSSEVIDKINAKDARDKADFERDKQTKDTADRAIINNNQAIQRATNITDIDAERRNLENAQATFEPMDKIYTDYNELILLDNNTAGSLGQKQQIEAALATLISEIQAYPYPAPDPITADEVEAKMQDYRQLTEELARVNARIQQINAAYPHPGSDIYAQYASITNGGQNSLYETAKNKRDTLQQNIAAYDEAQIQIDSATNAMAERQDISDHWNANHKDLYLELMGYWDFLQSGNTKSLFHWSTKNLQKRMDDQNNPNNMQNIMQAWMQQNHYAA